MQSRTFVLGFVAGCSPSMLLYTLPVLIFSLWRWWPQMDLMLFLVDLGLPLLVWAGYLAVKWRAFIKRSISAPPAPVAADNAFRAGYEAAREVP